MKGGDGRKAHVDTKIGRVQGPFLEKLIELNGELLPVIEDEYELHIQKTHHKKMNRSTQDAINTLKINEGRT